MCVATLAFVLVLIDIISWIQNFCGVYQIVGAFTSITFG